MAELVEILLKRKSCRKFKPLFSYPDPKAKIATLQNHLPIIAEAMRRAPYASGGPRYKITFRPGSKDLAAACYGQAWVEQAPVVAIFCSWEKEPALLRSGHQKYVFDIGAACMCADLRARDLGYETCWIGHFDPDQVQKAASLVAGELPVLMLLIGDADAEPTNRRNGQDRSNPPSPDGNIHSNDMAK